nr:hypothetical protein [Nannocystis sp.]
MLQLQPLVPVAALVALLAGCSSGAADSDDGFGPGQPSASDASTGTAGDE